MTKHYKLSGDKYGSKIFRSTYVFSCLAAAIIFGSVFTAKASTGVAWNTTVTAADSAKVYKVVEKMPEIVGGLPEIYKHISYPRQAIKSGVEGRVFIKFVVNENGTVSDPEIMKDIGAGCGEAAIEAIKKVKFTPGQHNGQTVKVQYALPVTFKLKK